MALCSECRRSFRTMEDEPADECPYCGYTGREEEDNDDSGHYDECNDNPYDDGEGGW